MLYLYLDESGDLGFDFINKRPSKFFTVTIMVVEGVERRIEIVKAIKKTLKHKLRNKTHELKGSKQSIEVKRYFYRQVETIPFELYALTFDKLRGYGSIATKKNEVYNLIVKTALEVVPLVKTTARVNLIIDRSKGKPYIREFNEYILKQLGGRIGFLMPFDINHRSSQEDYLLQAVDLFSWGIFRKYEKGDTEWYSLFESKVKYDDLYST